MYVAVWSFVFFLIKTVSVILFTTLSLGRESFDLAVLLLLGCSRFVCLFLVCFDAFSSHYITSHGMWKIVCGQRMHSLTVTHQTTKKFTNNWDLLTVLLSKAWTDFTGLLSEFMRWNLSLKIQSSWWNKTDIYIIISMYQFQHFTTLTTLNKHGICTKNLFFKCKCKLS